MRFALFYAISFICIGLLILFSLANNGCNTRLSVKWTATGRWDNRSSPHAQNDKLPPLLRKAAFNTTLACWHIRTDPRADSSLLHVAAEANFAPGERWNEVQKAINMTRASNPLVHYVLVTSNLSFIRLVDETALFSEVPHDVWYCPEVLYGTPIAVGNFYRGTKFACSIDNWFPSFDWQCNFNFNNQTVAYVVQRSESKEVGASTDRSCESFKGVGSADGIMFDYIPMDVVKYLRFPRTYWGCENLAMYAMQRGGIKLVNLCPAFAPFHVHIVEDRDSGRLRINYGGNSVHAGENVDIKTLCKSSNNTV